jgi:hypothetical protein
MMKNPTYPTVRRERLSREFFRNEDFAVRHGILKLLAIKDSDIRLLTLEQSRDAVDKGGLSPRSFPWSRSFLVASFTWTLKILPAAGKTFSL